MVLKALDTLPGFLEISSIFFECRGHSTEGSIIDVSNKSFSQIKNTLQVYWKLMPHDASTQYCHDALVTPFTTEGFSWLILPLYFFSIPSSPFSLHPLNPKR